jgi:DeoR family fructose operon transcriptional repressor
MLAEERRSRILARLKIDGFVSISELAQQIDVSPVTIRRDIDALDRAGLVQKLHGGAKSTMALSTDEPGFALKRRHQYKEKQAIGREAAAMVAPGMAVGVSAGTTTWALAQMLTQVPDLTVVTNSIPVATIFYESPNYESSHVILTGGSRTRSDALVGPVSVSSLELLHLDLLFLGVHGIDAHAGFTTPNLIEAETNRAFIRAARRLVVVADSSKLGVIGVSTMAPLDRAACLIMDDGVNPEDQALLQERVGELRLVPVQQDLQLDASSGASSLRRSRADV